ncbi:MRC1-like domain-containing protein [Bisporella sp. PMI_857]|nr:MRC1-like domain-containing protein [Bisporella sp. PMI_857]
MASSRESSPEIASSLTPQLTPTSKVKALLATFSDNSDEEEVGLTTARDRLKIALKKQPTTTHDTTRSNVSTTETESEDDEDVVRPKGRMAARMLARETSPEMENDATSDKEGPRPRKSRSPELASQHSEESEASAAPASRKRKVRIARRSISTPSVRDRSESPELFVSPAPPQPRLSTPAIDDSGSDLELPDAGNSRFQALVARKKQERAKREAKEVEIEARKQAERRKQTAMFQDEEDLVDHDVERRLTQSNPPTRKASKKALEDIHRETQRLSRSVQLTHAPITKKKYTVADFTKRFTFKQPILAEEKPNSDPIVSTSSPARHFSSDGENHGTPPSSPPSPSNSTKVTEASDTLQVVERPEKEFPVVEVSQRMEKGKGKAVEVAATEQSQSKYAFAQRPVKIYPSKFLKKASSRIEDSDSDLEIVTKSPAAKAQKLDSIFDRVPKKQAQQSHSLHVMRTLAHIGSPDKRNVGRKKKLAMTATELEFSLNQRRIQQARLAREEKLQALKDKGIHIPTAEERVKEQVDVEDLLERARRNNEEIKQREKAAARRERKANGEVDPLGDSSDDEDWEEGKQGSAGDPSRLEDDGDASDEDEEMASDEEDSEEELGLDQDGEDEEGKNSMFDKEADETDDDEAQGKLSADEDIAEGRDVEEDEEEVVIQLKNTRGRKNNIISDDEDEVAEMETPVVPRIESPLQLLSGSPGVPNSVLRSATKTFIPGLTVAGPAGLGLTQIFAGTMDQSQADDDEETPSAPTPGPRAAESMSFLRRLPAPELPPFVPTPVQDTQDAEMQSQLEPACIPESQPMDSQMDTQSQDLDLGFSQSQMHQFDSLVEPMSSQQSDFFKTTQDVGYQHRTPIAGRYVNLPPSTMDTVVIGQDAMSEAIFETPVVKKKGKLRRRVQVAAFSDEENEEPKAATVGEDDFEISANAFDVMRKAIKKKVIAEEFDKKKSNAKEMVHEQAEESEDEYAGLGGASDDDSVDEEDELVKEMIDDEGGKHVDESKLAAFFADRERENDEKQVEKLYNDITKGMLRRKRGADYDLSDSDDGGEARRRMKRKEFAKMRKALLADERIGKIAENPKSQAFLRAIEDRGSEDEMDFLEDLNEQEETSDSQSQSQDASDSQQRIPDSQPDGSMGPPKRKASDDATIRPPPHLRRTKLGKKPSNISEIRESLSSLIEEPNAMLAPLQSDSESEHELEIEGTPDDLGPAKEKNKENRNPFALRRTNVPIIDRISLKRQSSSSLSSNTRLAFSAASSTAGFKVPALLRRATTNSSITSETSNSSVSGVMSATERMAGGVGSGGIKRGGGKNSGVHYFARETERRAAVVKTEMRREQKRVKGAEARRKVVGGIFGGGKFD